MSARKPSLGERLIESMTEAVAIERGQAEPAKRRTVTARVATGTAAPRYAAGKVALIRSKLGLSQPVFAKALNVSPATVRSWEQNQRIPDGPSRRLLEIADRHPEVVAGFVEPRKRKAKARR